MDSHSVLLRDIPQGERPRERMLENGASALSQSELLAILLRTGTKNESAIQLAHKVLKQIGSLRALVDITIEELTEIKGIGQAKAIQLKAGIELGQRIARTRFTDRFTITGPADVAELLFEQLRYLQKEHFICLFLNTKNQVIAQETLSIGSLNATIVHPREIFRAAIKYSSAAIICAHNHPSGDPTPSSEDIQVTKRVIKAGLLIGIEVLDHVIVGDGTFISLKDQGFM